MKNLKKLLQITTLLTLTIIISSCSNDDDDNITMMQPETITEIAAAIPPGVASFLLTSKQDVKSIVEQQRRLRTNTIQLVDRLVEGTYKELKEALPGISVIQVIHVCGDESVEEAVSVSKDVDGILLDSGNQSLEIKELGGTGRTHNWEISKKIVESVNVPVFLAGGLNANNVKEAVRAVNPFGVDLCSGVRKNGNLDEKKLADFFKVVRDND